MRILVSCFFCAVCVLGYSQPITFLAADSTSFATQSSIYNELMHELPHGGYVRGYSIKTRTTWWFNYAYYNKYGSLEKEVRPRLDYPDPDVQFSTVLGKNNLFISGAGENHAGYKPFSYCFDSLGNELWSFKDSLELERVIQESDTNLFGVLRAHTSTAEFTKGIHLVRLKTDGRIFWSANVTSLVNQLKKDTSYILNEIVHFEKKDNKWVFLFKEGGPIFKNYKIALFDASFNLIQERYTPFCDQMDLFHVHNNGIVYNQNIGSSAYSWMSYTGINWDFNTEFVITMDSGMVSQTNNGGIRKIGSNFCFENRYLDSNYKILGEEKLLFYNYAGKKVRECAYSFPNFSFDPTPRMTTLDKGLIFNVYSEKWHGFQAVMLKTDSLGLVYNSDVICDCKDFNVGVEPQHKAFSSEDVKLFPNPASSKLNVLLAHQQDGTIEIIGINGQTYQSQNLQYNSNILDVSSLTTGVYFVRVSTQENTITKKFVVAR